MKNKHVTTLYTDQTMCMFCTCIFVVFICLFVGWFGVVLSMFIAPELLKRDDADFYKNDDDEKSQLFQIVKKKKKNMLMKNMTFGQLGFYYLNGYSENFHLYQRNLIKMILNIVIMCLIRY